MTHAIRPGRLEVETDLLLGVDDVLLPQRFERHAAIESVATQPAAAATLATPRSQASTPPAGRFDAALFATGRSSPLPSAARNATPVREEPRSSAIVEPRIAVAATEPVGPAVSVVVPIADRVVPPEGATRSERLALLERAHASECPHCTTATAHTNLVFGEGNPEAELVFVGEAPGETEDRTGRPFVGPAGEKLDEMIQAMGLRREEVYIANVLKSRPPNNRTPLAHEVDRCGPYLLAQLAVIRPKAIVTLGGPATKLLLASELGITRLRGVPATVRLGVAEGDPFDVPVMPTFHPAYLLRNYTVETRRQVWSDLQQALAMIGREAPRRA